MRPGEKPGELHQQELELLSLLLSARVSIVPLRVESALVADANGAAVERTAVSAHLQQLAVLRHLTVAANVEVVADSAELARAVVTHQFADAVVTVTASARAVDDEIAHALIGEHHAALLIGGVQLTLAPHLVSAESNGKSV